MSDLNGVVRALECRGCLHTFISSPLEYGELPVLNRFTQSAITSPCFLLSMAQCPFCELVQLADVAPIQAIVPQVSWVRYNEPAAHLSEVVLTLASLCPNMHARITSFSPFDQPLIEMLQSRYTNIEHHDILLDQREVRPNNFPYLETIQARLPDAAEQTHRPSDVLLLRYILEHCREPNAVLQSLKRCLTPNGILMIEVPDSTKFFERGDASFVWEEHTCYFTQNSLHVLLANAGFSVTASLRFPGAFEDALVVFAQPNHNASVQKRNSDETTFSIFAEKYAQKKLDYQATWQHIKATGKKSAMIGIGHQALMFLHTYNGAHIMNFFVDDDQNKQGLYASNCAEPIQSFANFINNHSAEVVFLAVGSKHEKRLSAQVRERLSSDIAIYSIFENSTLPTAIAA